LFCKTAPPQQGDLWLYAEQLTRWEAQALTDLAARLKPQTIDTILARSDVELGRDALLGAVTPHGRRKQR